MNATLKPAASAVKGKKVMSKSGKVFVARYASAEQAEIARGVIRKRLGALQYLSKR